MRDKELTSSSCAKAEALVAYLYNEASETEAKDFERHMRTCASCEAELAAFGHVRSSIAVWRSHPLGSVEADALATAAIIPPPELPQAAVLKPSAITALREFFALSPMWLRAATALTSLAICALVVWASARVMEAPRVLVVEKVVEKGPTQAEVDALVAKRVREELAAQN
nr:zf-HC2 domain-containing protein [Acidobacteriota bacterium]